jgi:aminopeptidase N
MTRLACILAVLVPALAAADTYPRQPAIDVTHYLFRLTVGDGSDEISGDATIDLRIVSAGVQDVYLDLTSSAGPTGMTVSSVTSDGRPVAFEHQRNRLRLWLPPNAAPGQKISFAISYKGVPGDGLRLTQNIHGDRTMFSENWPNHARGWLPMIDHPYDKATGEFVITAPAQYQVVSNGLLVEETDLGDGRRRTHWKQSVPISSWLYAVGIARFAVHHAGTAEGFPLQSWVFPQDRDKGFTLFEETSRQAMAFFSERIGPFSYEKLANVEAAGITGGTEHATAIFYGEKGVTAGRGPVVHEIAHQWWGNSVTERDWDDVWLSEGFATYFTMLFTEHVHGRDAFVGSLRASRDAVIELERKMPDTPVIHRNLSDMTRVLNQFVYQKGGWMLHMLRGVVGTEAFWRGMREYYRRYRNSNVSTDDFRAVMEEVSAKDLTWFFRQWLQRSGVPKLEGSWRYDQERRQIDVELRQSQPGEPYRLPVQIGIIDKPGKLPRVELADLAAEKGSFTFAAPVEPASLTIDPDTWLLFEGGLVPSGAASERKR